MNSGSVLQGPARQGSSLPVSAPPPVVLADAIPARQGRLTEAELRAALNSNPDQPAVHNNLGVVLAEQDRNQEAAACFRDAIRLAPNYFEAQLNLANTLTALDQRQEAIALYRRGLELRPDSPDALNGLGLSLTELNRSAEAAVYLRQAVRLRPDFPEAYNSLGLSLAAEGQFKEAEAAYERALLLKPRYAEALTNLAVCMAHQGRLEEALAQYDIALWLTPDAVTTRWNRSMSLLQAGDFAKGWTEYEWRWRRKKTPMRPLPRPMWDGSSLHGKMILLWAEQGLGDTIQFARYVTLVKARGAEVALECPAPLLRVLAGFPGVDQLVPEGRPLPEFDYHAPLMSLPRLLGTTLETIPAQVPYLKADERRVEDCARKLSVGGETQGLKVGIAWQGNPHHRWDRYRSVSLEQFAPLAKVPGVQLVSLQRGPGREQTKRELSFGVAEVLDPGLPEPEAWGELAALMTCLDLVVSVDTATAHLAGALGVRAWVALSYLSDWRWLRARCDTPWYPTLRLFRQDELGRWDPVFSRMAKELRMLAPSRTTDAERHSSSA